MRVFRMLLAAVLLGLTACNVYEFTHELGSSNDVNVLISDGNAAQSQGNYALAAEIFGKVLALQTNNSRGMVGYSTAVLYRDIELADIPKLMIAIYTLDLSSSNTNLFLDDLNGRPGLLDKEQYRVQMVATVSNACYWRAPVHGINRNTGILNTDGNGLPLATASDGVIAATERTPLLNYLIAKSVHVALLVREKFSVYENLISGIDVAYYTNGFTTVTNQATFSNAHTLFLSNISYLSNAYTDVTNLILGTTQNSSVFNLVGVADGFLALLSNAQQSGEIATNVYNETYDAIDSLRSALLGLANSLTNESSGVPAGLREINDFRTNIEAQAAAVPAGPPFFGPWYPY